MKQEKIWTKDFVMLALANLIMSTAFYFLITGLPLYLGKTIHADNSMIGMVLAIYTIAALIIRPFTGIAVDIKGRKFIYLLSLLIFGLLFNAYIFSVTIVSIFLLRFIHGLLWGITTTSASTVIVDIIPAKKRGEGLGIYGLSMTIAMAIGPILGLVLAKKYDYEGMFIIGSALCFIGFILASLVKYPKYEIPKEKIKFNWSNLIEKKSLPVSLSFLLVMSSYGGLLTFIVLYGKQIKIDNPGIFFLVYALGIAISRVIAGKIFDKKGPRLIGFLGFSLLIIGFPILSLVQNAYGFFGSALIMGVGNGILMPTFQAMINNLVEPHKRGVANSTLFTALDLGIGIGMVLTGFIADLFTISGSFLISTGICTLGFISFIFYSLKHYNANKL